MRCEDAKPEFWKPTFVFQHGRQGGLSVFATRGNVLTMACCDRKEVFFSRACPAKEIERMRSGKNPDSGEGEKERSDFSKGVSVEGEFAFTKAVGEF